MLANTCYKTYNTELLATVEPSKNVIIKIFKNC